MALAAAALGELLGVPKPASTRGPATRRAAIFATLGRWRHPGLE
jgi:hypothetical protein